MRGGKKITLPFDKAEEILCSDSQIIIIDNEKGEWSGISINKADITMTERDREAEREYVQDHLPKNGAPKEKKLTQKEKDVIEEKKKEISEKYKKT